MILDFKEIPEAHIANGKQDTFEMFARDFFETFGFIIEEGPDRGADGGRDLIIKEKRLGILGETEIKWLVSCKHKAHSGKSVLSTDEQNIKNRLDRHKANGFIGFYSTLPNSSLYTEIKEILKGSGYEYKIFDSEAIEKKLIEHKKEMLIKRYFPKSFNKIQSETFKPSNIFDEYLPLNCEYCGKDLLAKEMENYNIICFVAKSNNSNYVEDIYWTCKGNCDKNIRDKFEESGYTTSWKDISDISFSTGFMKWIMALLNNINYLGMKFSDKAFEKLKKFILAISQIVTKDIDEENKNKLRQSIDLFF